MYSMIPNTCNMHSISIFIVHNHWKSKKFYSLTLQNTLKCFYSPKHLFRFPAQEAKTRNAFAATQRKGLKGHSKSTINTFHRLLDIPSRTKEWEENFEGAYSLQFIWGKKELLNLQPMMAGKPSFASLFPIRGIRPVWRMNGRAEIADQPFPSSLK